jgi:hypothetical protein
LQEWDIDSLLDLAAGYLVPPTEDSVSLSRIAILCRIAEHGWDIIKNSPDFCFEILWGPLRIVTEPTTDYPLLDSTARHGARQAAEFYKFLNVRQRKVVLMMLEDSGTNVGPVAEEFLETCAREWKRAIDQNAEA